MAPVQQPVPLVQNFNTRASSAVPTQPRQLNFVPRVSQNLVQPPVQLSQPLVRQSFVRQPLVRQPLVRQSVPVETFVAPVAPVTQFDIARQPVLELPTMVGPVAAETPVVSQVETASSIEPATEAPLGSLVEGDSNLVSDANVVPAAASEDSADTSGTVSVLESAGEVGDSILDLQNSTDSGELLLSGPDGE